MAEGNNVPNPTQQKEIIKNLLDNGNLKVGDTWQILSSRWFGLWKDFVNWDDEERESADNESYQPPHAIDNNDLVDPEFKPSASIEFIKLKKNLSENYDYVLIPESAWKFLHEWYGGGPLIKRITVEIGEDSSKRVVVESYPLLLKLYRSKAESGLLDESSETEVLLSGRITVKELRNVACTKFSLDPQKVRIWNFANPSSRILDEETSTLEESAVEDGQKILVEVQMENGSWPRDPPAIPKAEASNGEVNGTVKKKKKGKGFLGFFGLGGSSSSSSTSSSSNQSLSNAKLGLCGLVNLGNTCFMNSALQCLSNTAPLSDYFLSNKYKSEINRTNVLGMKGKVAEEYGALLKQLWLPSNAHSSVAPRNFKSTIGKFAPQFSGYSQNDSQELLAFLLDGLHEDLNRVPKKPFVEVKEHPDKPDEEVAQIYWENHLKRDQSIIVDLFQGQLKSKLVCPNNHVSICFDPFMYLSLPLPIEKYATYDVIVIKNVDPWEYPIKYSVRVDKQGKIEDLKESVSKATAIPATRLLLADMYNSRLYAFLSDQKSVTTIRSNDVTLAYEIPENTSEMIKVTVLNRREKKKTEGAFGSSIELFGFPFIIYVASKKTTKKEIYEAVWNRVKSFVKKNDGKEKEEPEGEDKEKEKEKEKEKKKKKEKKKEDQKQDVDGENGNDSEQECPFPFKLSVVSTTGSSCGRCSSLTCNGCFIKYSDKPNKFKENEPICISIDWSPKFVKNLEPDFPKSYRAHSSVDETKSNSSKSVTLLDCLNLFTTDERLGANDMWYCPKCKEHHRAMKKFDLWNTPQILVIHLKRFQFTKWSREKLITSVDFPIEGLDLTSIVLNKSQKTPIYDLFAVSNHVGSFYGGHYYSYAKNRYDNMWYCFNDSTCKPIPTSEIISPSAYVLFYIRRDSSS